MSQSVTLVVKPESRCDRDPHSSPLSQVEPSFQVEILQRAKQGDPEAIGTLMNWVLQPKGITVSTRLNGDNLLINLKSAHAPKQAALVAIVAKGMKQLQTQSVRTLTVYGCQMGHSFPIWTQVIELHPPTSPPQGRRSAQLMVIPSPALVLALDTIELPDLPDLLDDPDLAPIFDSPNQPADGDLPPRWRTIEPVDVLLLLLLPVTLTGLYAAYERFPTRLTSKAILPDQKKIAGTTSPGTEAVSRPEQSADAYKPGPFEWSQNKAIVASRLVQVARTSAEWELAASQWQEAVKYMESVPIGIDSMNSAKQELVQSKLAEYRLKLAYTQDQAARQSGAIVGRLAGLSAPLVIAPSEPQITKDTFSHLRFGASYEQVATMLGMPGEGIYWVTNLTCRWEKANGSFLEAKFRNDRLFDKSFQETIASEPTEYDRIQTGMTFGYVEKILGVPQNVNHSVNLTYRWENPNGSYIEALFVNNKLVYKNWADP